MTTIIASVGDSNMVGLSVDPLPHSGGARFGLKAALENYGPPYSDFTLVGMNAHNGGNPDDGGATDAVAGQNIGQVVAGLGGVMNRDPNILLIWAGTVDLNNPTLASTYLIWFFYRDMIRQARKSRPGCKIICIAPPPIVQSHQDQRYQGSRDIQRFVQEMPRELNGHVDGLVIPPKNLLIPDTHMDSIGTHLSWAGYQLYAGLLAEQVRAILDHP